MSVEGEVKGAKVLRIVVVHRRLDRILSYFSCCGKQTKSDKMFVTVNHPACDPAS